MYAYGVIRGFPYQVDLTIDRRISLRAGAALELERGEVDAVLRDGRLYAGSFAHYNTTSSM